ncbi:MAG: NAD-dependent epimerase/dehydratase family protein [Elusimicrobia bacterium]|nr:NAD-dependent epimerase/dehydratase family protein [Elusimicrobiota bacterium]
MKILITGICGYVGSRVAARLAASARGLEIFGIDNLSRRGSESNLEFLEKAGARFYHGDVRLPDDLAALPGADWVIDCAANPSVMAGSVRGSGTTSAQLTGANLTGTLNLLEYCKNNGSGLILLSTSRVYSADALSALPLKETARRLVPSGGRFPAGFSRRGVAESFSTAAPLSLYGGTKLASEIMAQEYACAFGFPLWINRSGVIGGPGQFGKADQGIFSFWACSYALGARPKFIGYGGQGKQVRDWVSAEEIADLLAKQLKQPGGKAPRIVNVGGGADNAMSLRELDDFCADYFKASGKTEGVAATRPYDVPFYVTDARLAQKHWGWRPARTCAARLEDTCRWAGENRDFIRRWWGR